MITRTSKTTNLFSYFLPALAVGAVLVFLSGPVSAQLQPNYGRTYTKSQVEKLIKDGDTDRFNFSTQALLHAGNGGALDITFNSKSLGFMGQPGNIRAWRFSPEGYTDVPAALNRTCEIP